MTQDIFEGEVFDTATENAGGVFFLPGLYDLLEIEALKMVKSKNPKNEGNTMFVAEFKILVSKVAARPAGSNASWVVNLSKNPKMTMGDVKKFIAKMLQVEFKDVTRDVCRAAVSAAQPFAGTKVSLVAMLNNKETFTRHDWTLKEQGDKLKQLLAA